MTTFDQDNPPYFFCLSEKEQQSFGNGLGPKWFPKWLSQSMTRWACWFFQEASWRHHDFGYHLGHTEAHRKHYDALFLKAMLEDARDQKTGHFKYVKMYVAIFLSYAFWLAVRIFGRFEFNYGDRYDLGVLDAAKEYAKNA